MNSERLTLISAEGENFYVPPDILEFSEVLKGEF